MKKASLVLREGRVYLEGDSGAQVSINGEPIGPEGVPVSLDEWNDYTLTAPETGRYPEWGLYVGGVLMMAGAGGSYIMKGWPTGAPIYFDKPAVAGDWLGGPE